MSDILSNRESPRDRRPLSAQVRDRLEDAIRDGALRPGERLPGEHELAERLAIGRSTLREALRLLEQDGVIDVRHGKGRFVSALASLKAERPVTEFESVTEMLSGLGYSVRNRVLKLEERRATAPQARALQLKTGAQVIVLERLRLHGDDPLIYSLNVIDRRVVPGELADLDWSSSVLELLAGLGFNVVSSAAKISASPLPGGGAGELAGFEEEPWLCITETCVTDEGRPVLHAVDYHRGDIFAFHVVRQRSTARPSSGKNRRRPG
jgi:GntR family transcriptional regulator